MPREYRFWISEWKWCIRHMHIELTRTRTRTSLRPPPNPTLSYISFLFNCCCCYCFHMPHIETRKDCVRKVPQKKKRVCMTGVNARMFVLFGTFWSAQDREPFSHLARLTPDGHGHRGHEATVHPSIKGS